MQNPHSNPLNPFRLVGTAGFGVILLAGAYQLFIAPRPTVDTTTFNLLSAALLGAGGIVALAVFVRTIRASKP